MLVLKDVSAVGFTLKLRIWQMQKSQLGVVIVLNKYYMYFQ